MKCVLQAKSKTSVESWNFIPSFLIQLKKKVCCSDINNRTSYRRN